MKSSTLLLAVAAACCWLAPAPAQDLVPAGRSFGSAALLTVEQQREDLEFLRATVADVHPATAGGLPTAVADALAAAAPQQPRTPAQFWHAVQPALLALHDAHSTLLPPNTGEALALPLAWLQEGMIVGEEFGTMLRGDKILD